jgi:hypothetical protein
MPKRFTPSPELQAQYAALQSLILDNLFDSYTSASIHTHIKSVNLHIYKDGTWKLSKNNIENIKTYIRSELTRLNDLEKLYPQILALRRAALNDTMQQVHDREKLNITHKKKPGRPRCKYKQPRIKIP